MDQLSTLRDLPQRLSQRLRLPLPVRAAQQAMEPELGFGRHFGPSRPDARPAAVAALLHRRAGQWQLPLLLRPESLAFHGGQISLPGGTIEQGETSHEAALRELEEELGIARAGVLLLGQLSPLYLFGSNFLISPWVATTENSDVQFQPSTAEVKMILEVPLAHFLDPATRGRHVEQRGSVRLSAPHFAWQEHFIWGATAMILAELIAILSGIVPAGAADSRIDVHDVQC